MRKAHKSLRGPACGEFAKYSELAAVTLGATSETGKLRHAQFSRQSAIVSGPLPAPEKCVREIPRLSPFRMTSPFSFRLISPGAMAGLLQGLRQVGGQNMIDNRVQVL